MEERTDKRRRDFYHESASGDRYMNVLSKTDEELYSSVGSVTISMACPQEKVGPLIGKRGVVVQEIMRKSSCRIYVDQNFPDGLPRQIQLTGHPRDLSLALTLVTLVLEHGPAIISPLQPGTRDFGGPEEGVVTESDFTCPSHKVGALIGPKGNNMHEIYRRTGCRIQVLQEGVPEGVDRHVSFTGTPQQVAEAKSLCTALISGNDNRLNEPLGRLAASISSVTGERGGVIKIAESDIDPEKVRLVIGAKGVTIGEIMKRSGCKIFVNQNFPEGQCHKVVYTGTAPQIDVARFLIDIVVTQGMAALYAVLNGTDSVVIQEMSVSNGHADKLEGGALQEIQARCQVKVSVDDNGSELNSNPADSSMARVSIIGRLESVHSAIKLIYQALGLAAGGESISEGSVSLPLDVATGQFAGGSSLMAIPALSTIISHVDTLPSSGPILALGKDGNAGHLESAVSLSDGSVQQVAEIKNEVMGKVVGTKSSNISLIQAKSGANVQVLKADVAKGSTRIVLTGAPGYVSLAAQMVQEVLVNGPGKLLKMSDVGPPANATGMGGLMESIEGGGDYFPGQASYYAQQPTSAPLYSSAAPLSAPSNFNQYPGNVNVGKRYT